MWYEVIERILLIFTLGAMLVGFGFMWSNRHYDFEVPNAVYWCIGIGGVVTILWRILELFAFGARP